MERLPGPELPDDEPDPPLTDPRGQLGPPPRLPPTAVGAMRSRPPSGGPTAAACTLFLALEQHDWNIAAAVIDPDDVSPFRARLLGALVGLAKYQEQIMGGLLRFDPDEMAFFTSLDPALVEAY